MGSFFIWGGLGWVDLNMFEIAVCIYLYLYVFFFLPIWIFEQIYADGYGN